MKRLACMTVVGILWLVLYFCILIKVPFYIDISRINLPEDCKVLETKVVVTDVVYGWHIEAERLLYSMQGEEMLNDYIDEHNKFSEAISLRNLYASVEYDNGFFISDEKYPYQEQDSEKYILLHRDYSTDLFNVLFLVGIAVMIFLCWLTHRNLKQHRKTGSGERKDMGGKTVLWAFSRK